MPKKKTKSTAVVTTKKDRALAAAKKSENKQFDVVAEDLTMDDAAQSFLKIYGSYVVENRAVPEARDGLKPVHRAALWAAHRLGVSHSSGFRKSAKIVGDVIGMYHPHGDGATYDAIVGLANGMPNLVRGEGNWGSPISSAAAMRYTEMRLSLFSDLFLLDKDYLKVVRYVPNYDGTEKMPLHLPALLPNLMLMGTVSAPAYGVSCGNPPFALDGVVKIVTMMLQGKKVSVKHLAKYLKTEFPYGNEDVSPEEDFVNLLKTGKGSLTYRPVIEAVWGHKNKKYAKKILIKSYSPNFRGDAVKKQLDKIAEIAEVGKAYPNCGKKDPRAGKYGCLYIIEPKRGVTEDQFYDLAEKIQKQLTAKQSYSLGCTFKKSADETQFKKPPFVKFFEAWIKYRITLEGSMLKHLIEDNQTKLDHQELLLFAVNNREKLLKLLPKVLKSKTPDDELAKALKKPVEFAKRILDLQIRRLALLEKKAITDKIKELKATIKDLKSDLKDPNPRIINDLNQRVKKYKAGYAKYDVRK